jgi:hypothetical protein
LFELSTHTRQRYGHTYFLQKSPKIKSAVSLLSIIILVLRVFTREIADMAHIIRAMFQTFTPPLRTTSFFFFQKQIHPFSTTILAVTCQYLLLLLTYYFNCLNLSFPFCLHLIMYVCYKQSSSNETETNNSFILRTFIIILLGRLRNYIQRQKQ